MTNKPHKNILFTLRTIFKNAAIDINSLYKEGVFDTDPACKYNNYMNRFYHQVLKETAEGPISADIYRHCMEASQRDGMILAYIQNQTPDLCLAAVNQNGGALYYVKNQTNKIAEVAVRADPSIFPYVKDKTDAITKIAIKADGLNIAYVENRTAELALMAVKQNGMALKYIMINKTREVCLEAVKQNGHAIRYIDILDDEIVKIAIDNDPSIFGYISVTNMTPELRKEVVSKRPMQLKHIPEQTDELCLIALNKDINAIDVIRDPTLVVCLFVAKHTPFDSQFIIPAKYRKDIIKEIHG